MRKTWQEGIAWLSGRKKKKIPPEEILSAEAPRQEHVSGMFTGKENRKEALLWCG